MNNLTVEEEKFKKLLDKLDFKGLAKAYAESDIEWNADNWEDFVTHIQKEATKDCDEALDQMNEAYNDMKVEDRKLAIKEVIDEINNWSLDYPKHSHNDLETKLSQLRKKYKLNDK